jgi:predicted ribosomally synthesized peptide with nif11-like leader
MASIDELMVALSSNSELRQSMASATTPEEAVAAAADAGFEVTTQELLEAYKSKMSALSDDELASISGGKGGGHPAPVSGLPQPVNNNPDPVTDKYGPTSPGSVAATPI